mgnify:CR=1 FL=1
MRRHGFHSPAWRVQAGLAFVAGRCRWRAPSPQDLRPWAPSCLAAAAPGAPPAAAHIGKTHLRSISICAWVEVPASKLCSAQGSRTKRFWLRDVAPTRPNEEITRPICAPDRAPGPMQHAQTRCNVSKFDHVKPNLAQLLLRLASRAQQRVHQAAHGVGRPSTVPRGRAHVAAGHQVTQRHFARLGLTPLNAAGLQSPGVSSVGAIAQCECVGSECVGGE